MGQLYLELYSKGLDKANKARIYIGRFKPALEMPEINYITPELFVSFFRTKLT
jgi:hypothetical protein